MFICRDICFWSFNSSIYRLIWGRDVTIFRDGLMNCFSVAKVCECLLLWFCSAHAQPIPPFSKRWMAKLTIISKLFASLTCHHLSIFEDIHSFGPGWKLDRISWRQCKARWLKWQHANPGPSSSELQAPVEICRSSIEVKLIRYDSFYCVRPGEAWHCKDVQRQRESSPHDALHTLLSIAFLPDSHVCGYLFLGCCQVKQLKQRYSMLLHLINSKHTWHFGSFTELDALWQKCRALDSLPFNPFQKQWHSQILHHTSSWTLYQLLRLWKPTWKGQGHASALSVDTAGLKYVWSIVLDCFGMDALVGG